MPLVNNRLPPFFLLLSLNGDPIARPRFYTWFIKFFISHFGRNDIITLPTTRSDWWRFVVFREERTAGQQLYSFVYSSSYVGFVWRKLLTLPLFFLFSPFLMAAAAPVYKSTGYQLVLWFHVESRLVCYLQQRPWDDELSLPPPPRWISSPHFLLISSRNRWTQCKIWLCYSIPSVTTTSDRFNTTVQQQQLYSVHTYRYVATISTSQVPWKCRHSSLWHSNCDHSLHITKWRRVDLGVAKKEEKRIKFLWIDEPYRSTFNDVKVPPRFELGLPDSESGVLTITPWDHIPSIVFND